MADCKPRFIPEKHVPLLLVANLAVHAGRVMVPSLHLCTQGRSTWNQCISQLRMLKSKEDGGMKFDDFLKQGVVEWVL